jgi:methylmalonyl-CoA mutase
MTKINTDWTTFEKPSADQWVTVIEKELKGKDWKELAWYISNKVQIEPAFQNLGDTSPYEPILKTEPGNPWLIGEFFNFSKSNLNKQLLLSLEYGLEAPFVLNESGRFDQLDKYIEGVIPSYINLMWVSGGFEKVEDYATRIAHLNQQGEKMSGGFLPNLGTGPGLAEDIKYLEQAFRKQDFASNYKYLHISPMYSTQLTEDIEKQIGYCAAAYYKLLLECKKDISDRVLISIDSGDHLLLNIAKIRALKILIANVHQKMGYYGHPHVSIHAFTDPGVYGVEENTNRVRSAAIGWSLASGGADIISLLPGNLNPPITEELFNRRIARNMQHILRMESFCDQVADPFAGSYYIETLSSRLAEAAWDFFVQSGRDMMEENSHRLASGMNKMYQII